MTNNNWQNKIDKKISDEKKARKILGVSEFANKKDIKLAWKQKLFKYHPDKTNNNPIHLKSFILINCAYYFLVNNIPCPLLDDIKEEIDCYPENNSWAYFVWWKNNFF